MSDTRTVDLSDMEEITINGEVFVRRSRAAPHKVSYVGFDGDPKAGVIVNGRRYIADELASTRCGDPYVEDNVAELRRRAVAGLAKYGKDLTREDLTSAQWLQHLIEELLDAANYARVLISRDAEMTIVGYRWRHKDSPHWIVEWGSSGFERPKPDKSLIIETLFAPLQRAKLRK
jgi:hypothetical protein